MMILRATPASPFGRKTRITALLKGLGPDVKVEAADAADPNDSLRKQNPLGKIPALILADGNCLYDSHVICEYLDAVGKSGPKLFPAGEKRWEVLRLAALCDGILDASILQVYEARYRPEAIRHQPWLDMQAGKTDRALAWLEVNQPTFSGTPDYGTMTLACALGYRDFRFGGSWRKTHPKLVAWLESFAKAVPAFGETKPE